MNIDGATVHLSSGGRPGDDDRFCCAGAALRDVCSCWEETYDRDQAEDQGGEPEVRPSRCDDCACRPDSPERTTPELMASSVQGVLDLAADGVPFYCHDGMRRLTGWEHPDGSTHSDQDVAHNYAPPMRPGQRCDAAVHGRGGHPADCNRCDGSGWLRRPVPLRADGRPALICNGWNALADARRTTR
jgi:PAS domain-containing protein